MISHLTRNGVRMHASFGNPLAASALPMQTHGYIGSSWNPLLVAVPRRGHLQRASLNNISILKRRSLAPRLAAWLHGHAALVMRSRRHSASESKHRNNTNDITGNSQLLHCAVLWFLPGISICRLEVSILSSVMWTIKSVTADLINQDCYTRC